LSSLKAMNPAPANNNRPNTTIGRRLRQNEMRDLNITVQSVIPSEARNLALILFSA